MKRRILLVSVAALAALFMVAPQIARSGSERKSKETKDTKDRRSQAEQGRDALDKQKQIARTMADATTRPATEELAAAKADLDAENTRFAALLDDLKDQQRQAADQRDKKQADKIRKQIDRETDSHDDRAAKLRRKIDSLRGSSAADARDDR